MTQKQTLAMLQKFTKHCREDMHEPDEQGIFAEVVGRKLDNAFGNTIFSVATSPIGSQEMVVVLTDRDNKKVIHINLCDLIALARKAVL